MGTCSAASKQLNGEPRSQASVLQLPFAPLVGGEVDGRERHVHQNLRTQPLRGSDAETIKHKQLHWTKLGGPSLSV